MVGKAKNQDLLGKKKTKRYDAKLEITRTRSIVRILIEAQKCLHSGFVASFLT